MLRHLTTLRSLMAPILERPRLDLTLLSFALAGLGAALLLPQRAVPEAGRNSYALAISAGDRLRLETTAASTALAAAPTTAEADLDPEARVLACRNVVSVGALDIGARCKPGPRARVALGN